MTKVTKQPESRQLTGITAKAEAEATKIVYTWSKGLSTSAREAISLWDRNTLIELMVYFRYADLDDGDGAVPEPDEESLKEWGRAGERLLRQ